MQLSDYYPITNQYVKERVRLSDNHRTKISNFILIAIALIKIYNFFYYLEKI
jgi:hypothetical protein